MGFEFVEPIGAGGYADVFLYEQLSPSRRVAVKVLDVDATPGEIGRAMFATEANVMAKVSAHPYIVQVFQSDLTADGRPYLVMEYYPGPNFMDRARHEQLAVDEVLRVAVQLASAVETAHRAGIMHRDIKPANVLTSEYRRPGLTDFGIASVQGPTADTADGVSIPWSPPEAFGESTSDRRGDVYSLAATIYTLLVGRSPFEVRGGDNSALSMMGRIERSAVPSIGRPDVPGSLERVLVGALAKDPAHRPATAAELGRQLQAVESELRLAVTQLELAEDLRPSRARADDPDDDATRVKGVTEVRPHDDPRQGPAPGGSGSDGSSVGGPSITGIPERPVVAGEVEERRREGLLAEPEVTDTVVRPHAPDDPGARVTPFERNRLPWAVGGIAAAAALVLVVVLVWSPGGDGSSERPVDAVDVNDGGGGRIATPPPPLEEVSGVENADGTFTFSWDPSSGADGYSVAPEGAGATERIEATEFTADVSCVEVQAVGENGLLSAPTRGCA